MDPLSAHDRAQQAFAGVLANMHPDQLANPTPCTEWTVTQLIEHVVGGNNRVGGNGSAELDADVVAAHASSAQRASAAFAVPDAMNRMFEVPVGTFPGSVLIVLRTLDVLVHAWDLARSTGQSTDLDAELAAALLAIAQERVTPQFRGPGRPFAEEQPCPDDRPAADRLAAFVGRSVI